MAEVQRCGVEMGGVDALVAIWRVERGHVATVCGRECSRRCSRPRLGIWNDDELEESRWL